MLTQTKDVEEVLKSTINEIMMSVGKKEVFNNNDRLKDDLGIDSLQFVRLILELEIKLNRKIFNIENIPSANTIGDLIALCKEGE